MCRGPESLLLCQNNHSGFMHWERDKPQELINYHVGEYCHSYATLLVAYF